MNATFVRFGKSSLRSIGGPELRQVEALELIARLDHALGVADVDVLELERAPGRPHRAAAVRSPGRKIGRRELARGPSRRCKCGRR